MLRRMTLILIGLMLSTQAFATDYIVKFKEGYTFSLRSDARFKILDQHNTGRLFKISVDDAQKEQVLTSLLKKAAVDYIVPDFKLRAFSAPLSPYALKDQWAVTKVNAEKAWKLAGNKGNRKVLVAVIDTGVDYDHESLKPNTVQGYNFRDGNDDPMDKTSQQNPGHGTHCAGIIGATGLVDGGIIGISPEVSIMPLRFLGEDGSGDLMAGIKAIDYAISKGVKVISASWGATVPRAQAGPLIDAVKRADDAGVIFVVAAANDGRSNDKTDVFPANAGFPNTIAVAASGPNDEKPSWSNYGRATVHVAAPGLNIMSTLPKNKYGNLSGTSMATPLVSGLVALLKAQDENLTGMQARALLQVTGVKANIETACNCRVDAGAAMEALLEKKMYLVPSAGTLKPGETQAFNVTNGLAPFKFEVANTAVATVDDKGLLTAVAEGETSVKVTDAAGKSAETLAIRVATKSGGGENPGQCPIGEQVLCDIMCAIEPSLPWCTK